MKKVIIANDIKRCFEKFGMKEADAHAELRAGSLPKRFGNRIVYTFKDQSIVIFNDKENTCVIDDNWRKWLTPAELEGGVR